MNAKRKSVGREIEFWFDFGSNYSYLSVMRIEALAEGSGVTVLWRPFLLAPIFKSFGWDNSPFVLQKAKGVYVWRDMQRQCRKYGLPWTQPSVFPRRALLPLRLALLGANEPWIDEFCRRTMLQNFAQDRDIDRREAVTATLDQLGLPAETLLREAEAESNKQRLRDQTQAAMDRGIFGAPTFLARGEMYWGNDRLDDALEAASID
jgi:2-hydroxychromene-2-carboxylate isomerase